MNCLDLTPDESVVAANAIDGGLIDDVLPIGQVRNGSWKRAVDTLIARLSPILGRQLVREDAGPWVWGHAGWDLLRVRAVNRREHLGGEP